MKRYLSLYVFLLFTGVSSAQQTPNYTQFVLNQYALNPAYAGTNLDIEAVAGRRLQWIGMPNAPSTTFASVTYGWRKNYSYKGKHGVGLYAEDDRQGLFSSKAAYLSYSYHIRVFTGLNISAGISVGARQMGINSVIENINDPALTFQKSFFTMYPDVIPGMRFYTKKLFIDISARQLYKNSISQGSLAIGNPPVQLNPVLIFSIKRRIPLGDNTWVLVPAANVQANFRGIPYAQANCMVFYNRRIGVGASLRSTAFASAILQVKVIKNATIGFSYDYTISRLRAAAANSFEIIAAFTPGIGEDERGIKSRKVANCPDFDY